MKYRPCNGEEGLWFMSLWCGKCVKDTPSKPCGIIARTMALDIDHKDYPKKWQEDDDGPRCTAFLGPRAAASGYHPRQATGATVVKRVPQNDLFGRVPAPKPAAAAAPSVYRIEPFTAWDAACCIPDPAWVIPAELALPCDDPDWQPVGRFG